MRLDAGGEAREAFEVLVVETAELPREALADDVIGRQVLLGPRVGELMAWIRQPAILAALVAGVVTAVVVSGGGQRRAPTPREDAPPASAPAPHGSSAPTR